MMQARSQRILIVEDNLSDAVSLRAMIEDDGYLVIGVAGTGAKAKLLVASEHPDLVLLDLDNRQSSAGLDLAVDLQDRFDTPILFVSGRFEDWGRRLTGLRNVLGFVVKPYSREQLQIALRLALPLEARRRGLLH